MANTFGILAALVLAFAAFVAVKNKESLQEEVDTIKSEGKSLKRNQDKHEDILAEIDTIDGERTQYEAEQKVKSADVDKQNAKNADVETQIAEKVAEAKEAEGKADEADEVLKELGDIRELIVELKGLKTSIADLDDQLSIAQAQVSQLENDKTTNSTEANDLADKIRQRTSGKSYFVSTRIRSIYRNWGFVTLGAGDTAGVVTKSKLKVMRGEQELARLIVTAVEENTAAASIIPSSVNEEIDISVGDVVVPLEDEPAKK